MADSFDFTKTLVNGARAIKNDLIQATGLGAFTDNLKKVARLGGNVRTGGTGSSRSFDVNFEGEKDFRAKIWVPGDYTVSSPFTTGLNKELTAIGGIIFPYTPSISQDYTASYSTFNPTHSNYGYHFYKSTVPGAITVSGKFTVQNDKDAFVYLASIHLLRSLMKMHFGQDEKAGQPPPVCRFSAYGTQHYNKVPVVIQSVKVELPDSVDYYTTTSSNPSDSNIACPTVSTISVTMLPVYSRNELLGQRQVDDYIGPSPNLRQRGYL